MPKELKEFYVDHATGKVSTEYNDDSTGEFNLADSIVLTESGLTKGGVALTSSEREVVRAGMLFGVDGLTVSLPTFSVDGFEFNGGSITLPANGAWYIGVELSSKQVRALPRLGHRGWVPIGKAVTGATVLTSLTSIEPVLPASRIPRTLTKVLAGEAISVVIMGSSLTSADNSGNYWPGMVFGGGDVADYKLPGNITLTNVGLGASPNHYQLAQLGFASSHDAIGSYTNSGATGAVTLKRNTPNGRSVLLDGVDLVVIGCLANGGDYRLQVIEPLVRKLRKAGVEVIIATDNAQGPSTDYSAMTAAGLYIDGPEIFKVADLYGVEVADTAAYVAEAHIRTGGVGIYGDTIHMAGGAPIGPESVAPANGHEAWARAVRSVFSVSVVVADPVITNVAYDFASGVQGWGTYAAGTPTNVGGALVVTKNTGADSQWGATVTLPVTLQVGDTATITATATYSGMAPVVGLLNGPWASGQIAAGASGVPFTGTLVATNSSNTLLLFGQPNNAPLNTQITLDDVSIVILRATSTLVTKTAPNRKLEVLPLPPIRVVKDYRTPADAFIVLPKDERYLTAGNADKGVLSASPFGAGSFARRWSSTVGAAEDLLVLATGKKAAISGDLAVGFSLIHYRTTSDGACTFEVRVNGSLQKTITIGAVPFGNEWYQSVLTPTEVNLTTTLLGWNHVEIVVTVGTLKVAAFVALTPDLDFVTPDEMLYVGPWLPREISRSGADGIPTDTLGAAVGYRCQGRRMVWLVSGNPGSKPANIYSDKTRLLGQATVGNYHVQQVGSLVGSPGAMHWMECAETNASGSQAEGRALHVVGAIVVNDR